MVGWNMHHCLFYCNWNATVYDSSGKFHFPVNGSVFHIVSSLKILL